MVAQLDINVVGGEDVPPPPPLGEDGVDPAATGPQPAPSAAPVETPDPPLAAQLQPWLEDGLMFAFRRAAAVRGPHWLMERDEAALIAEPAAGELAEALPSLPFPGGVHGALESRKGRLAIAVAYSLKVRIQEDVRLAREHVDDETRDARQPVPIRPRGADTGMADEPSTDPMDIAQATLDARAAGLPRKD